MRRCLVLALLVTACPLAFAQAYKWKDAQGVTHYADAPPPGNVRYEKIKTSGTVEAPAPASTAAAAKTPSNGASANTDTPENRKKLCEQLRKNLTILNNEKVVTMDDGKGGMKQVDDAERQSQIKTTQAQMTLYCGS
ncbi:DUF4124 domain-containing protein [Luteibacter flocculans]|uniref:DUF4124 domain-containing protein n=1 Tax=Luteibacter flocculans TaxID=2780091 RepID=A0ABY4SXU2_9GAMM|nr:DUF4124 domain-containing protein [Luteibacter flocculans]URL57533.1 DUF4124 domain-containing protein [Luteibacter flocculans]